MKILHVNTFDVGGAAQSCIRLHRGLLDNGIDSKILLKNKQRNVPQTFQFFPASRRKLQAKVKRILYEFRLVKDPVLSKQKLKERKYIESLPIGSEYFSFPRSGLDVTRAPEYHEADIIHLHWVADFIDYSTFFRFNKKPLVWTLHDMGPFQGGLHYQENYLGVDENGKPKKRNFSDSDIEIQTENLLVKKNSFTNVSNLHVVAPSSWLKRESENSELFSRFPHYKIPYGVDENIFSVRNKVFAREVLGLPTDKKIVLFVADSLTNSRKGFAFLYKSFKDLVTDDFTLCAIGRANIPPGIQGIHLLGRIDDERLMGLAYSAADVFVIPSLEDNLPNTVLESLLCGTPVVGFPVGGIKETIEDGVNGFLCTEISVNALTDSIRRITHQTNPFNREEIAKHARECFNLGRQAASYVKLYSEILK